MAKTYCQSQLDTNYNSDNVTIFNPVTGVSNGDDTEARSKIRFRTAGTFSNGGVFASSNSSNGSTVATLRVNGVNSSLTMTMTASTTGLFQDNTHNVAISAGDDVNWQYVFNGGSGNLVKIQNIFCGFQASSGTMQKLACTGINIISATPQFHSFNQNGGAGIVVEANVSVLFRTAGTLKNGYINVTSNTQTGTCTWRSRVNSGNGNIIIAVGAGATGVFEDTANSDVISSGDLVNFSLSGGDGTHNIAANPCAFEFVTTNLKFPLISGNPNTTGTTISAGTTVYQCLCNQFSSSSTTEANFQMAAPEQIDVSNLWCDIVTNGGTTNGTVDLRVAGASSALTVSITALTTGTFEDATHTVTVPSGSLINLRIVTGATAATIFGDAGVVGLGQAAPPPGSSGSGANRNFLLLGVG